MGHRGCCNTAVRPIPRSRFQLLWNRCLSVCLSCSIFFFLKAVMSLWSSCFAAPLSLQKTINGVSCLGKRFICSSNTSAQNPGFLFTHLSEPKSSPPTPPFVHFHSLKHTLNVFSRKSPFLSDKAQVIQPLMWFFFLTKATCSEPSWGEGGGTSFKVK